MKNQLYFWTPIHCRLMVRLHCKENHFPKTEATLRMASVNPVRIGLKSEFVTLKPVKIIQISWKEWNSHRCHGHMTTKDYSTVWVTFQFRSTFFYLLRKTNDVLFLIYSVTLIKRVKPMVPKQSWTRIKNYTIIALVNHKEKIFLSLNSQRIHHGECKWCN